MTSSSAAYHHLHHLLPKHPSLANHCHRHRYDRALSPSNPELQLVSKEIFFDRVARTHSSVVRSRAKLSLHRSQPDTSENSRFCFAQLFSQSLDDVTLRRHTPTCSENKRVEVSDVPCTLGSSRVRHSCTGSKCALLNTPVANYSRTRSI